MGHTTEITNSNVCGKNITEYIQVFIIRSLNQEERQKMKILRKEVKEKNEERPTEEMTFCRVKKKLHKKVYNE